MKRFEHKELLKNHNIKHKKRWLSSIDDENVKAYTIEFYPYLEKLGSEGWEVVAIDIDSLLYVLKREIP